MKLTTYFIKHPVIALILNAMIVIIGLLSLHSLNLREYPEVKFPTVTVRAFYPNASSDVVETSVTSVLEDQLAGVEGIDTITSKSKYGGSQITLNFQSGVSIDRALLAIREAISRARNQLPQEVKEPVVERQTVSDAMPFLIVALETSSMDFAALTHYANIHLKNAFRSNKGVASVEVWGQPYTYQIHLNPKKMYSFGINVDDIYNALQRNHVTLPVGKFRDEIPVTLNTELKTTHDYENIVIKNNTSAALQVKRTPIVLKDVADVSLGNDDKQFRVRINGKPGLCIAINRTNDGNPLDVSALVHEQVAQLQQQLPSGLKMYVISDQADFVRHSLKNIQSSIIEAIIFVLLIVFFFLRNIKATLIPLVTIPISLLGSLLFLKLFNYSINIITLMAMVLAVGLVVDDAIVVLENIQRHIEDGLSAMAASIKGAKEIGFAIVAMTLTLTSVYAPLAFISGTVGQLFTEFAVALAGSVLISGVVALTLSPLMCSKTLSHHPTKIFARIDLWLQRLTLHYQKSLTKLTQYKKTCVLMVIIALSAIVGLSKLIPSEMAPKEDRGLVGVYVPPIPGKDINTMEEKIKQLEKIVLTSIPEAQNTLIFMGTWGGSIVLPLKAKAMRTRSADDILESIRPKVKLPSLEVHPWSWDSALPGLDDTMSGGEIAIVVSTTESYRTLFDVIEKARLHLDQKKLFTGVRHNLTLDVPSYRIDLDQNAVSKLNLTTREIAKTIEIFFSGDQSLVFFKDGVAYAISINTLNSPWSLNEIYVTNSLGKRISLGAIATMVQSAEPDSLFHYNQMRSVILKADLKSDDNIEKTMPKLQTILKQQLPTGFKTSWTGAAKAYSESKTTVLVLFMLALIFIYAILAVQFENFIDPLIILLTVPLACSGALFFVWFGGQSLNIFTQVGLVTLIGLITKHGILIVEFANQLQRDNRSRLDAVIQAATLRLRPILMTTGAMLFGAIPLVLSHDAGFEARRAIGTVLIGGLTVGTIFTLFILPTLYLMIKNLTSRDKQHAESQE